MFTDLMGWLYRNNYLTLWRVGMWINMVRYVLVRPFRLMLSRPKTPTWETREVPYEELPDHIKEMVVSALEKQGLR